MEREKKQQQNKTKPTKLRRQQGPGGDEGICKLRKNGACGEEDGWNSTLVWDTALPCMESEIVTDGA